MSLTWQVYCGSALDVLQTLPQASVDCCVTSPPYFAQRDYGSNAAEIGRETTPAEYVSRLVEVFQQVANVLKSTGALWLNLGDTYAGGGNGGGGSFAKDGIRCALPGTDKNKATRFGPRGAVDGVKPKDLIGIPWMVAFALRADGWYLRRDQIWHKPNPMPDSTLDRPGSAHEYVFLLSKSRRYFFDPEPIREPLSASMLEQMQREYTKTSRKDYDGAGVQNPSDTKRRILASRTDKQRGHSRRHAGFNERWDAMTKEEQMSRGSLPKSVWTIPTNSHDGKELDHFALMPRQLARKCIVSACPAGGTVLDPFAGCATTGVVALEEGRSFVGIELNAKYAAMARKRLSNVAPLLASEASA